MAFLYLADEYLSDFQQLSFSTFLELFVTSLIAFQTYREETIELQGEKFTLRFTKRKDQEEYALFATNAGGTKNWRGFHTPEVAREFNLITGKKMEEAVYKVLRSDIEQSQ